MKQLLFVTGITLLTVGCGAKNGLDSEAQAVISADDDTSTTENTVEQGLEVPLSGVTPVAETGAVGTVDVTSADNAAANVTLNSGSWFMPAGCIASTQSG